MSLNLIAVNGIEWCETHQGIADELSWDGEHCDMAEDDDPPCRTSTVYRVVVRTT